MFKEKNLEIFGLVYIGKCVFICRYGTLEFCSLPTSVGQPRFSDVDKCRHMLNFAKLKDYKVGNELHESTKWSFFTSSC